MDFTYNLFDIYREKRYEYAFPKLQKDLYDLLSGEVSGESAATYFSVAHLDANADGSWTVKKVRPGTEDYSNYVFRPTVNLTGMLAYSYLNFEEVRKMKPLRDCLQRALRYCAVNAFSNKEDARFTASLFQQCNVAGLICAYPEFNPAIPADPERLEQISKAAKQICSWSEQILEQMKYEAAIQNLKNDDTDDPKTQRTRITHTTKELKYGVK